MTGDLLDEAEREACERLGSASRSAPAHPARVYAEAVLRLAEAGRREGENFYDAYQRLRHRPSAAVVALVLIHRDQFGRERPPPPVMH